MSKHTGRFEARIDRLGERDAARELHRDKLARRQSKRDAHDNPAPWQFKTVSGNRKRRELER